MMFDTFDYVIMVFTIIMILTISTVCIYAIVISRRQIPQISLTDTVCSSSSDAYESVYNIDIS